MRDPRPAIGGVFKLMDTYGVALVDIIDGLSERGARISLLLLLVDACNAGWTKRTIMARLREAAEDCHDSIEHLNLTRWVAILELCDPGIAHDVPVKCIGAWLMGKQACPWPPGISASVGRNP